MSDGREERAEQEMRREEAEKLAKREDWLDRNPLDEVDAWEPERNDS
ncbi:hypothetical protein [Acidipila sp. EB88]|nr:hypothetical protein [Acidipila sp. EB88]